MTAMIEVQGLGKEYSIRHEKAGQYETLREAMVLAGKNAWQRVAHPFSENTSAAEIEAFWALRDLNFTIERGDRVGIIGANGAGKSTLLKVLSRITEPSVGRVTLHGRVASLLEVGTGFHSELSGRENIYLNGAILGMTRQEIRSKFDEIVAFAEVDRFLDTPVKRYSSGMYVRLAFAVAA
ncbi:MAG: lipopolysaccharide transport system ATP-binding protein, partial [Myxococcota bacterium]